MLLPVVGLLFIGLSFLIEKAKRNFFIGIRTPWTLSSDTVWEKTHKLGAQAFRLGGALIIVSAFLGENGFWLLMAAILFASLIPVGYSYFLWRQENP